MPNEKEIARLERRLEHEAYGIEYEQKNAGEQIAAALATMQRFLDDAKQVANDPAKTSINKVGGVMHALAWGYANTTSSLENAMGAYARERTMELERAETLAVLNAAREAK